MTCGRFDQLFSTVLFEFAGIVLLKLWFAFFLILAARTALAVEPGCQGQPLSDEEFLQKLAASGDVRAEYDLALFYDNDERLLQDPVSLFEQMVEMPNVESNREKYRRAEKEVEWLQKAAGNGHAEALFELGEMYSVASYSEAALAASAIDQLTRNPPPELKLFYSQHGVLPPGQSASGHAIFPNRRSPKEFMTYAVIFFEAAAAQGDANAAFELAWCYAGEPRRSCFGVKQDYQEAYFWLASLGGRIAGDPATRRGEYKKHLSAKQMVAVDERVRNWKPVDKFPDENKRRLRNLSGLACGGTSRYCSVVDRCGDFVAISCPGDNPGFHFVKKMTGEVAGSCGECEGCDTAVPKEWACGWPSTAPRRRNCSGASITF